LGEAEFQQHFGNIVMAWTARDLAQWSACTSTEITAPDVEPHTWQLALAGRALSASDFIIAQVWLDAFTRRVVRWWEDGYDLLLTPTMAEPPAKLGEMVASPENPMQGFMRSLPFVAFTAVFNVTGQPAISLPLSWNANGLPIGVQLVAPFAREDMLLRVAAQLEQAQPWSDRRPPIHA
jgi:amidase